VAPPFKVAEFDIMYNEGISKVGDILDLGVEMELISKRGSFYSYADLRLGQGRENAKGYLRENPELSHELELAIRAAAGLDQGTSPDGILEHGISNQDLGADDEEMSFETTEISSTGASIEL
jgi:recombination protein RecA